MAISQQTRTFTDKSGTTNVSGGISKTISATNNSRLYLMFQNISGTDMWVNFGVAAVASQPSIKVIPGAMLLFENIYCPTGPFTVICSASAQPYCCKEMSE